jgi:2-polyprenyl-3-methyl-5-hydroxy-6-metoxy-1,4-benzoquinol methylase
MGLYFELHWHLCAFDQVCKAAATGKGCHLNYSWWMGKLSNEKHDRQLVQTFIPSLDSKARVAVALCWRARIMDLGCGHGICWRLIAKAFPGNTVV